MFILLIKSVTVFEFTIKQRYIKDCIDNTCDKVKITGVFTNSDLSELANELKKFSSFDSGSIVLQKSNYVNGLLGQPTPYTIGEQLNRGDSFCIYVKSSSVSNYSRVENGGISLDDSKNLYYTAKTQCRIE
jgi:hypothetical protein